MREYGQVQSAFWQSTDAQTFTDHGKLLALYLLTGPHANGIGCYWLPNGYITADLNWASKDVEAAFTELSGNGLGNGSYNGFAYRFDGVVFIPKFLKWNKIANPNVASARFAEFDALSNTEAKRRAARAMLEFYAHWSEPQRKTLETVAQTVPQTVTQTEPNPTQPNPTKREKKPLDHRADDRGDGFDEFWSAYPRKVGKANALKAWRKIDRNADTVKDILGAIAVQRESEQWCKGGGQFIPHPATWLNGRRWEDEVSTCASDFQDGVAL